MSFKKDKAVLIVAVTVVIATALGPLGFSFIYGLMLLLTLYRSYHDGYFYGQRKPEHIVGEGSVL